MLIPRWDWLAAAGVLAIGAAAPVAAVVAVVVAGTAIGIRLAGHHATGAMVWQAEPWAGLVAWADVAGRRAVAWLFAICRAADPAGGRAEAWGG